MDRFQCTIEVDAAPGVCYEKWHHFEQFPHFMDNVEEVQRIGEKSWHWIVNGPLGHRSEWDAEIDQDEQDSLISWHSLSSSEVAVSGVVHFQDLGQNKTQIVCNVEYEPPGGVLGEAVAHLFVHPDKLVQEELLNFKHLVEHTNIPAEKAHAGRVMHPDPFVVPPSDEEVKASEIGQRSNVRESSSATPAKQPRIDEEGYELLYGMEDDIPTIGTSAELETGDIKALETLNEEESPYLGLSEGAVYSEDLIDMRNDNRYDNRANDIYSESMDVFDEDLESYTENLDSEIDVGLGTWESLEEFEQNPASAGFGPQDAMGQSEEIPGRKSGTTQSQS